VQHDKQRLVENEDIVSLVDIIQFLSRNSKFLGVTTAVLSVIAIAFSLLTTPKQYQKQLSLSLASNSLPLTLQSSAARDVNQMGALAVEFLEQAQLDPITVKARYNADTQKIYLILQSPEDKALSQSGSQIVSLLKKSFQQPLRHTLESTIAANELSLQRQKLILAQLDQQIAKFPPTNKPGLEALQTQRAQQVTLIGSIVFDQQYLEKAHKNIAGFSDQVMSVEIWSESGVQQTRSSGQIGIIAIVGSFMVAVLAAIARNQIPRLKNELSKHKIDRSTDL
jgi:hypothetical protein